MVTKLIYMITVWYFQWLWPNHLKLFLYPNSVKFGSWRTGIHYGRRLDSSRIQVFFLFCDSFKCLTYLPSHLLNCNPGRNTLVALQASNNEHFIYIPVFCALMFHNLFNLSLFLDIVDITDICSTPPM